MSEEAAPDKVVSLGELASIPGIPSEPTLRKMIEANADFPLVSRGTNGSAYEIPLAAAIGWIRAHREAEEEAARARSNEIRQLGLALLGEGAATEAVASAPGLSASEQKAALEAEILAIRVGRERGELVKKSDVEARAGELAVTTRREILALPDKFAKRADVSREALVELRRMCARLCDGLADHWGALGADPTVPDDRAD